jgi:signal peptidase I
LQFVLLFGTVLIATLLIMRFVISKDVVQGPSMEPGLESGDRLISLRLKKPKRNDIVVLYAPKSDNPAPGELYIKRVIGMPGDTVESKNDKLYVNGKQVKQNYLSQKFIKQELQESATEQGVDVNDLKFTGDFSLKTLASTHRATVPAGEYFVMGDNRYVSHDGRAFGFIPKSEIQSVVGLRYWPLSKIKFY